MPENQPQEIKKMDLKGLQKRLEGEFPSKEVKSRTQAGQELLYISTDSVINRLNRAMGITWDTELIKDEVITIDGETIYRVVISLNMHDRENGDLIAKRIGVGCDKMEYKIKGGTATKSDPDKAVKTAYSEAIKNAAKTYGVALYLWEEEQRKHVKELKEKAETPLKPDQVEAMKDLKKALNIKDNHELDVYVKHWSDAKHNGKFSKYTHLTTYNIDDFIKYANENKDNISPV